MPEIDISESSPEETLDAVRQMLSDPALTRRDRKAIRLGVKAVGKGKAERFDFEKGGMAVHLKRQSAGPDAMVGISVEVPGKKARYTLPPRTEEQDDLVDEFLERWPWHDDEKAMTAAIAPLLDELRIPEPLRWGFIARVTAKLDERESGLVRERRGLLERIKAAEEELDGIDKKHEIFAEVTEWMRAPLNLQRPDGSAFHKLQETMRDGAMLVPAVDEKIPQGFERSLDPVTHAFVVNHDWAAAFKNATDFEGGEWHMPYEHTAFEFVISGKRVIFVVSDDKDRRQGLLFVNCRVGWAMLTTFDITAEKATPKIDTKDKACERVASICLAQIRAIVIALEAEVAVTEVVRAPHKLNAAREKRGRLPILDYHVVSLARRTRYVALPDPASPVEAEPRRHPRLHFVRGHWRHFANHKTWIRWFLRGDHDLGFIDKSYRL
jgi:hypothetical protein